MFILFVLIHELTHMILGIILGFKPKKINVMPFGFKVEFKDTKIEKNKEIKKIAIACAGPLSNLLIMVIAIILNLHKSIIYINLIIALFNLIPIYPLDGSRIIKSILKLKLDDKKTDCIINKISNLTIILLTALSSIIILYIKNINIIFVLIYLWYIVIKENRRYKLLKRVYDVIENKY